MRKFFLLAFLLTLAGQASAAEADLYWLGGTSSNGNPIWIPVSNANPMPTAGGGGGTGCVPAGGSAATNVITYGVAGACAPDTLANLTNGALTLGQSGTLGAVLMGNATSGLITLQPQAGALGSVTVLIPAASDTLVNLASAQPLTNKTYNGLTITASTGTLTIPNGITLNAGPGGTLGSGAFVNTGTSGATLGLLNGNNTYSGNDVFSGTLLLSGLSAGTQVSCLGLDSGNHVVLLASACGAGGGGSPAGSTHAIQGNAGGGLFEGIGPLIDGQIAIGQTGGAALAKTITGDCTLSAAGVTTCAKSGTITNAQAGTTYTILTTDQGKIVTLNNASAIAVTLPQAGSTGFAATWGTCIVNIGAGTATVTPTISTFNLNASQTLPTGASMCPVSDGTNYAGSVAVSGGTGTVTTTGSPTTGKLTKFSGATSVTNGDLSGDVTTSGGLVTTLAAGNASNLNSGTLNTSRLPNITDPVCATWDSTTAVTAQTIDFPIAWATYTIGSVKAKVAGGGSFTYAIKIGGTAVTSCNVVTVNSSSNVNTSCTAANTGAVNDIVSVVIASPSGTVNQAYVCPVFSHTPN